MEYGAISITPEVMNGTPVFSGTNVPVQSLFEYLEDGKSTEKFLSDFPAVNKKDVVEVLQMVKSLITNVDVLRSHFTQ